MVIGYRRAVPFASLKLCFNQAFEDVHPAIDSAFGAAVELFQTVVHFERSAVEEDPDEIISPPEQPFPPFATGRTPEVCVSKAITNPGADVTFDAREEPVSVLAAAGTVMFDAPVKETPFIVAPGFKEPADDAVPDILIAQVPEAPVPVVVGAPMEDGVIVAVVTDVSCPVAL